MEVHADDFDALAEGEFGGELPVLEEVGGIADEPGGLECFACDHHAVAVSGVDHALGVEGGADVAVADAGDFVVAGFVDGVDDFGDPIVIDEAFEALVGGSAVDGDALNADVDELFDEVFGGAFVFVIAEACFGGDGDLIANRIDECFCKFDGVFGGAEHHRAGEGFGDFINGAAHVDIEGGGTVVDGPFGSFGHEMGVLPVELHAEGAVFVVGGHEPFCLFVLLENPVGTEEVGECDTCPAEASDGEPEGEVAMPGDGGEHHVGFKLDVTNFEHEGIVCGEIVIFCCVR